MKINRQITLEFEETQTLEQLIKDLREKIVLRNTVNSVTVYNNLDDECKQLAKKAINNGADQLTINRIINN